MLLVYSDLTLNKEATKNYLYTTATNVY